MKKLFCKIIAVLLMICSFSIFSLTAYAEDEEFILPPKVLVKSYNCTSLSENTETDITAGDKIIVRVTLINTSKTQALQNMTVTAAAMNDNFILSSISDCQFIEFADAGSEIEVFWEYEVKSDTPAGQYEIGLSYDYFYGKGAFASGTGIARVTVTQPLKLELSLMRIPEDVVISDTISVGVQAINLSRAKAYNVRAEIEADGFAPYGTAYIGDIEGGMSAQTTVQVTITGLTKSHFPYGQTKGTVTFYYEDTDGNEFTETKQFSANIESPFSELAGKVEDEPGQWWIIMAIICTVILIPTVVFVIKKIKGRSKDGSAA